MNGYSGQVVTSFLPHGWTTVTLKDVAERITKGSTPTSYGFSYRAEGIRFVKAENIDVNGCVYNICDFIDDQTNDFLKRSILKDNDLLFSIAGTIGRVGLIRENDLPANTNQALAIIRLIPDILEPKYLLHYLKSEAVQKTAIKSIVGVGRANLSLANLGELTIPVAPLCEQTRIVAEIEKQFSRLDEAVANLKRVKANLKRYKAAVLKAAVEGKLTEEWRKEHPDIEPASKLLGRILAERRAKWEQTELTKMERQGKLPGDEKCQGKYSEPHGPESRKQRILPQGWLWTRAEQLGNVIGGLTQNRKREDYARKFPYLRVANVYSNELRLDEVYHIGVLDEEAGRALLEQGDLLIVEGNGSRDQIGRLAIWDGSINPCVHQNHLIKLRLVRPEMGKFVLWWLLSGVGREYVTEAASSTSGLYTLSVSKVGNLPVPLPPEGEQRAIVAEVEACMTIASRIELEINQDLVRADRLRQSILKKAFSGQLI